MNALRKQRLFFVIFILIFSSITILLVTYALRENINLFYPPSKIAAGEAPIGQTIRAGGCVVGGSVQRSKTNLEVSFVITDGRDNLKIHYTGILPDLFEEGEAVVVNGKLDESGQFNAAQVLAKHDENYVPVEVAESLKSSGNYDQTCEILKP